MNLNACIVAFRDSQKLGDYFEIHFFPVLTLAFITRTLGRKNVKDGNNLIIILKHFKQTQCCVSKDVYLNLIFICPIFFNESEYGLSLYLHWIET